MRADPLYKVSVRNFYSDVFSVCESFGKQFVLDSILLRGPGANKFLHNFLQRGKDFYISGSISWHQPKTV